MADAVHFATNEDTIDPTKSSGFNGFPAPFRNNITGNEDSYPIEVSFVDLIKHYWRVKKWQVSCDLEASVNGSDPMTITNGPFTFGIFNSNGDEATSERQLVFQGGGSPGFASGFIQSGTGGGALNFLTGGFFYLSDSFFGLAPSIYNNAGTLKPQLFFTFQLEIDDLSGNSIAVEGSTLPIASPTGIITATVDGYNIDFYYKIDSMSGISDFSLSSFDITPYEYWPYTAADASPIYNTSTGAQLQDPRN